MAKRPWKEYGRYGTVGIELVISLLVGLFLGKWADERWNTAPWLTLLGLVVGVYAGFRQLLATTRRMQRDMEAQDRAEREAWLRARNIEQTLRRHDDSRNG